MPCDAMLAVGNDYRTHIDDTIKDGWVPVSLLSTGVTFSQFFGISEETLEFADIFDQGLSIVKIDCVEIEETAPTTAMKADLLLMLFSADPTVPSDAAVYDGDTANHVATISIAAADYERVGTLVWKARKTGLDIPATNGLSGVTSLFGVLLSNETGTWDYDALTELRVRVFTAHHA